MPFTLSRGVIDSWTIHLAALFLAAAPSICLAQSTPSEPAKTCDQLAADAKRAWAANPHNYFTNTFHKESFEIRDTWCRLLEAQTWGDRRFKGEDFGRTLFTGEGIHPSIASSLVPGSGLATGVALDLDRAFINPSLRLSGVIDGKRSSNGSTMVNGGMELLGSGNRPGSARHNNAMFFVENQHLTQIKFFGPDNSRTTSTLSYFGLDRTVAAGDFEAAASDGLLMAVGLGRETNQPFSTTEPAIAIRTTYLVYGARLRWIHPTAARLRGNRVDLLSSLTAFHETHGSPYSFRRLNAAGLDSYTPRIPVGTFSLIGHASLAFTASGNTLPVYEQPTIGGSDLGGAMALRSFSDYRFRAPNALAASAEWERSLIDPVGGFLFVDTGRIAANRSALMTGRYRHSFGAGLTLRLGGTTVFRFFYAWGGGEGSRKTSSGSSDSFVQDLVSRGLF